jgi:hypothetical protein
VCSSDLNSPGFVSSGCLTDSLAWWLENIEQCAEENNYTPQQQKEYRLHIEHIAAWMRLYGYDKHEKDTPAQKATAEGAAK